MNMYRYLFLLVVASICTITRTYGREIKIECYPIDTSSSITSRNENLESVITIQRSLCYGVGYSGFFIGSKKKILEKFPTKNFDYFENVLRNLWESNNLQGTYVNELDNDTNKTCSGAHLVYSETDAILLLTGNECKIFSNIENLQTIEKSKVIALNLNTLVLRSYSKKSKHVPYIFLLSPQAFQNLIAQPELTEYYMIKEFIEKMINKIDSKIIKFSDFMEMGLNLNPNVLSSRANSCTIGMLITFPPTFGETCTYEIKERPLQTIAVTGVGIGLLYTLYKKITSFLKPKSTPTKRP